jgi:hypothetical protein
LSGRKRRARRDIQPQRQEEEARLTHPIEAIPVVSTHHQILFKKSQNEPQFLKNVLILLFHFPHVHHDVYWFIGDKE